MCTVLLPPGDNPIAVNKYIIYHTHTHTHTRTYIYIYVCVCVCHTHTRTYIYIYIYMCVCVCVCVCTLVLILSGYKTGMLLRRHLISLWNTFSQLFPGQLTIVWIRRTYRKPSHDPCKQFGDRNPMMTTFSHPSRSVLGNIQGLLKLIPRLFPRRKAARAWRWLPSTSSDEVKERMELYVYAASGASRPVLGWTVPLLALRYKRICLHEIRETLKCQQNFRITYK